jgi:hypothetical protein
MRAIHHYSSIPLDDTESLLTSSLESGDVLSIFAVALSGKLQDRVAPAHIFQFLIALGTMRSTIPQKTSANNFP